MSAIVRLLRFLGESIFDEGRKSLSKGNDKYAAPSWIKEGLLAVGLILVH